MSSQFIPRDFLKQQFIFDTPAQGYASETIRIRTNYHREYYRKNLAKTNRPYVKSGRYANSNGEV